MVDFQLPETSKIISAGDALERKANLRPLRGSDKMPQKGIFYAVDDMLLQLNGARGNPPSNYLENLKSSLEEMYQLSLPDYFVCEIKSYKGFRSLLINYERTYETVGYARVTLLNDSKTTIVQGILEYRQGDRQKALNTLEYLIKSMKFK